MGLLNGQFGWRHNDSSGEDEFKWWSFGNISRIAKEAVGSVTVKEKDGTPHELSPSDALEMLIEYLGIEYKKERFVKKKK